LFHVELPSMHDLILVVVETAVSEEDEGEKLGGL
jgi:hypothetical protein